MLDSDPPLKENQKKIPTKKSKSCANDVNEILLTNDEFNKEDTEKKEEKVQISVAKLFDESEALKVTKERILPNLIINEICSGLGKKAKALGGVYPEKQIFQLDDESWEVIIDGINLRMLISRLMNLGYFAEKDEENKRIILKKLSK